MQHLEHNLRDLLSYIATKFHLAYLHKHLTEVADIRIKSSRIIWIISAPHLEFQELKTSYLNKLVIKHISNKPRNILLHIAKSVLQKLLK